MVDKRHKTALERKMKEVVKDDKARIEIGRLSRFGLLEMSRQRLRASLASQSHLKCQHCQGNGKIKNPELTALEVLRKLQGAIIAGAISMVRARLSPVPALFLLNNKKKELTELEGRYGAQIYILADGRLRPDEYELSMESKRGGKQIANSAPVTRPVNVSGEKRKVGD